MSKTPKNKEYIIIARRRLNTDGIIDHAAKTITYSFDEIDNITTLLKYGYESRFKAEKVMHALQRLKKLL